MDVTNKYAIIIIGQEMVMGKVEEVEGRKVLKKPMLLMMVTQGQKMGVRLINMIGNPNYIPISKGIAWYYVEDTNIIDLYLKTTTGLVLNPTVGGVIK